MTEDEAKTKWCCANIAFPVMVSVAYQADTVTEYSQKCQGSSCMAWRWSPTSTLNADDSTTIDIAPLQPTDGYCGLAE